MLMPFIALYLTEAFGISMVEMGIIYIIVGIGNMIGGIVGGSLTDKFGRKKIALFGLLSSGAFSLVFRIQESGFRRKARKVVILAPEYCLLTSTKNE